MATQISNKAINEKLSQAGLNIAIFKDVEGVFTAIPGNYYLQSEEGYICEVAGISKVSDLTPTGWVNIIKVSVDSGNWFKSTEDGFVCLGSSLIAIRTNSETAEESEPIELLSTEQFLNMGNIEEAPAETSEPQEEVSDTPVKLDKKPKVTSLEDIKKLADRMYQKFESNVNIKDGDGLLEVSLVYRNDSNLTITIEFPIGGTYRVSFSEIGLIYPHDETRIDFICRLNYLLQDKKRQDKLFNIVKKYFEENNF